MKVFLREWVWIQTQRKLSITLLFSLASLYICIVFFYTLTGDTYTVLLTMETHLELRCQLCFMIFPCSYFLPCCFKCCLQSCNLTSKLVISGLNGNKPVGEQIVYTVTVLCRNTHGVYRYFELHILGTSETCRIYYVYK